MYLCMSEAKYMYSDNKGVWILDVLTNLSPKQLLYSGVILWIPNHLVIWYPWVSITGQCICRMIWAVDLSQRFRQCVCGYDSDTVFVAMIWLQESTKNMLEVTKCPSV